MGRRVNLWISMLLLSSSLALASENVQANPESLGSDISADGQIIGPMEEYPSLGLVNGGIYGFAPTSGWSSGLSTNFSLLPAENNMPEWSIGVGQFNLSYGFSNGWALLTNASLLNWSSKFGSAGDNNSYKFKNNMGVGVQYTTSDNYQYGLAFNADRWQRYNLNGDSANDNRSAVNYTLSPYMQKVIGQNAFFIQAKFQKDYAMAPTGGMGINNQTTGTAWSINPQYSFLATPNLTYSTQFSFREASVPWNKIADSTDNADGDKIEWQYFNLSYNCIAVPGLSLAWSSKIQWNRFRGPMGPASDSGYYSSLEFVPKVSYSGSITDTIGFWVSNSLTSTYNITPVQYVTGEDSNTFNRMKWENNVQFGLNSTFDSLTLSSDSSALKVRSHDVVDNKSTNISGSINHLTLFQRIKGLIGL